MQHSLFVYYKKYKKNIIPHETSIFIIIVIVILSNSDSRKNRDILEFY